MSESADFVMENKAIDIHHHYVPQQLIDETKRHGKTLGVGITEDRGSHALSFAGSKPHRLQPALMDVDRRIETMDQGQVAIATLEANTNSLGYRLTGDQGENWCRLYNDCMNELVKERPDRFVGMATVPLQDAARAAKVLEHAIIDLKFRGAFVGTNVNGQYYNIKDFDYFWAKAQELDVLIVMHPEHIARRRAHGLLRAQRRVRQSGRFDPFTRLHVVQRLVRSISEFENLRPPWRRLFALSPRPLR